MSQGFMIKFTDDGMWMHAPGSDFLFAFIQNDWSPELKESVGSAFQTALTMSNKLKDAVKNTAGQTVLNGLYLLDQPSMTDAMNSIPGMGMTTVDQNGNRAAARRPPSTGSSSRQSWVASAAMSSR